MRKLFVLLAAMLLMCACNEDYDDSTLMNRVENLENRVAQLEELCKQMNTNISSLHTLVAAIENKDYVTGVAPIIKDGKEVGYTITFTQSEPITIYHGNDGKDGTDGEDGTDGKDGITPSIGVKAFTDGIYYWTINKEWLLDENGNKVRAAGTDGKDGQNGTNGSTGATGKDGVTPQLKIENDYWYVSYDTGTNWIKLGAATNSGSSSNDTDDTFQKVEINDNDIVFTLKDGTSFTLPKYKAVKINFTDTEQGISAGATVRIPYTLTNATSETKISTSSDGNYKVKLEEQSTTAGTIVVTAPKQYTDGYINILVSDGNGYTSLNVISFYELEMTISGQEQEQQPTYSISTDGGTIDIPLKVNFDYTVEIPAEAADWISSSVQSRAVIRNELLELSIKTNTTLTSRSCVIRLIPKNGLEAFIEIIIQQASAVFSINKSHFIAKAERETFIANIQSTAGLKVKVPSADTWVTASVTSTNNEYTLEMAIAENTSTSRRNSIVELYSEDGNTLLATINIAQLATNEDALKDLVFMVSANIVNDFTVYLPIGYKGLDCIVAWGDGTQEAIIYNYMNIKYPNGVYHKYTDLDTASEFEVRISGIVPELTSRYMPEFSRSSTISAVKQWGNTQLVSVESAFYGMTFLKSIPADDLGAFSNIESFRGMFANCSNLSAIPENLFNYCTRATNFQSTFYGCSNLSAIPENLFSKNVNATDFSSTFYECSSLTTIPENLFNYCTQATNFQSTFHGCSSLSAIPENLFSKNVNATHFSLTFYKCSNLSAIPENLFSKNINATNFDWTFYECSSLSAIPENLFASCPKVTNFNSVFSGCGLHSIPVNLFDNNRRVSNFRGSFQNCLSVQGESPYSIINGDKVHLYERYKYPTEFMTIPIFKNHEYCYSKCTQLSDYENIPTNWK